MPYEKLEREGKVAVLYSPGFGAGWSTWNAEYAEELMFDKELVDAVDNEDRDEAARIAYHKYPNGYYGGASDLVIYWLPKGTRFTIDEYDGSESIRHMDDRSFTA